MSKKHLQALRCRRSSVPFLPWPYNLSPSSVFVRLDRFFVQCLISPSTTTSWHLPHFCKPQREGCALHYSARYQVRLPASYPPTCLHTFPLAPPTWLSVRVLPFQSPLWSTFKNLRMVFKESRTNEQILLQQTKNAPSHSQPIPGFYSYSNRNSWNFRCYL